MFCIVLTAFCANHRVGGGKHKRTKEIKNKRNKDIKEVIIKSLRYKDKITNINKSVKIYFIKHRLFSPPLSAQLQHTAYKGDYTRLSEILQVAFK